MKKRVAAYVRVSTTEQADEGYSIEAQIDNIRQHCKTDDKILVEVYADKGISGKSIDKRIELQKLINDCKKNIFDEVVVWKTSRLARNVLDLLQIVKVFEVNNITFKSLTEPYDTSTPTGKLMMSLLGSFAEFERTTTVENLKMGMAARAKQGYKNGGKMMGYRSEGKGKDSKLVIVPDEAIIIKRIYELYLSGRGYKSIANTLNKEGHKTIKGNYFSITAVRGVLMNATYAGKITFNKLVDWSTKRRKGKNEDYILVDGKHEAIISYDTFLKVQEMMKTKEDKYRRRYSGKFQLSGLLVCPVCGHGMVTAHSSKKLKDGTVSRISYYSSGQFRNKGSMACRANSVRKDKADEYVFNKLKEVLLNEKVLKDIVDKLNIDKTEKLKPLNDEMILLDKN